MAFDPHKIRLFVEADLVPGGTVELAKEQVHYLRNVMRRNDGDAVHLFNGRQGEWRATLAGLAKKSGAARLETQVREQAPPPDLVLCFAPIKGARVDFVAQKATELGVSALQPVVTERTIVRKVNADRLRANAVEAAEQCECLWVPQVTEPVDLPALLAGWPEGRGLLFCDEAGEGGPLDTLAAQRDRWQGWGLLIGPEGGFTDRERKAVLDHLAAVPIGLGPRILRADTAAIAGLSLLQAALGDWSLAPRQG